MLEMVKKYFLYFMMYAVFGWCYEVFLEVVVYQWGFSDRGVLFGPYCPVYGVGALTFLIFFRKLLKNKSLRQKIMFIPVIFIGCMFIATFIELVASYLCEFFLGSWPWQTYVDYKYNFQARIALSPSIRFGLGGVLFLYLLQPFFEKMIGLLSKKWLNILFSLIAFVFIIDIIFTIVSIL